MTSCLIDLLVAGTAMSILENTTRLMPFSATLYDVHAGRESACEHDI